MKKRRKKSTKPTATILIIIIICIATFYVLSIISTSTVELEYEVLFSGFITVDFDNEYVTVIPDPIVFNTKEEWDSFGNSYLTNHYEEIYSYVNLFGGINFEEESMIYYSYINPKAWYDDVKIIESIAIEDSKLNITYSTGKITVLNPVSIKHPYIFIAKVSKSAIPENLENIYSQ